MFLVDPSARRARGLLIAAVLGVVLGPLEAEARAEGPAPVILRVAYEDAHNFPFHLGTGGRVPDQDPGLSLDLVRLAADSLGIEVRFERLPWRRCLRSIGEDEVDGVFNASFREDRRAIVHYPMADGALDRSRRIMTSRYVFYGRRDAALHWTGTHPLEARGADGEAFAGAIGSVHGYSVSALLRERDYLVDDVGTRNSLLSLRKLLRGRVPVIVDAESRMRWFIAQDPQVLEQVEVLEPPVFERDYFLVLSHGFVAKHPELAEQLWDEIGRLRDAPELAAVRLRYEALLSEMSVSRAELAP